MTSLHLEHLKAEIASIITDETYVQAPTLIMELFEEKTLEIRQEATLYLHALELLKDMLEADSYQGHAFDKTLALKYVKSALGIEDHKSKTIPQIVEVDGKFQIEQFTLPIKPPESEVCTQCGYLSSGVHDEDCDKFDEVDNDDNYGHMDEICISTRPLVQ